MQDIYLKFANSNVVSTSEFLIAYNANWAKNKFPCIKDIFKFKKKSEQLPISPKITEISKINIFDNYPLFYDFFSPIYSLVPHVLSFPLNFFWGRGTFHAPSPWISLGP